MALVPKACALAIYDGVLINKPLQIQVLPNDVVSPPSAQYTWTVTYEMENTVYTLQTMGQTSMFSVPYATLVSQLGGNNSSLIVVTVETFYGLSSLGTVTGQCVVKTGAMPLSLWDDMQGNVGVTFGLEASGSGVNFMIDSIYGSNAVHPDIDFSNATVSEWFRYQAGETYSVDTSATFSGMITGAQKDLIFSILLPRSAEGRTVTVNSMTLNIRGVNGLVESANYDVKNISSVSADAEDGRWLRITCSKSTAWSNTTNNTPVVVTAGSSPIELEFN